MKDKETRDPHDRNMSTQGRPTDSQNMNYESKLTDNVLVATDEDAYRFLGEIKMTASNPSQSMRSSCRSYDGGCGLGSGTAGIVGSGGADVMKMVGSSSPPSPSKAGGDPTSSSGPVNSFLNNVTS